MPAVSFIVILVLVFSSLSFTACQKVSKPQNTTATLTFSTWGSAQEMAVLKPLLKQFEDAHPGVKIKLLHIPDNYFHKLHILIAGGLAPDVMFINSLSYPIYASHDLFLDLSPHINKGDFYPQALESFRYASSGLKGSANPDAKAPVGAIPRDISNLLIYYNKDWFQKAKLQDPTPDWTWKDLVQTGRRLTVDANRDGKPERFGLSFYTKPPLFWLPFVWSADGKLFDDKMQWVTLDEPAALNALQFIQDLRWQSHIAPRQAESGGVTMSQLFLQEKVAMLVSGRWSVPVFSEQAGFDWDVVPLPVGPSGQSRVGIDASGYAVSKTSRHPKEAIMLARFLTSRQAVESVAKSGLIVPARKDVAESPVFLNPGKKPLHSRYFLSVIPEGIPTRTPPRWNEFSEELMLALQPVWDDQKTPQEALTPAVLKKLNRLLKSEVSHD